MKTNLFRARLEKEMAPIAREYLSCLEEDKRIIEIDLIVVKAHCLMLAKQKYLSKNELKKILWALKKFKKEWYTGELKKLISSLKIQFTDIHPFVEKYVIDSCGLKVGGKINLGRSRNDQIATDLRIYLREELILVAGLLSDFVYSLLKNAAKNRETVFPGYTHRQPAQVTTYAHYLLSYGDIFLRDLDRLKEIYRRVNLCPLGASALAGTTIKIDRKYTAQLLGFEGILENSIDAVSNRDFLLELANELVLIMLSLSRLGKDLLLWSTFEYGIVELADEFTDISTAMPQKKNASTLEILQGKTSLVTGLLSHLYNSLKGLETGYNQELQELKPALWKIIDLTKSSIKIMQRIITTLKINKERISEILEKNYIGAIDFAEYLQESGQVGTFREAHFFVGNLIKRLILQKKGFSEITPEQVGKISKSILGKEIHLTQGKIKEITDPLHIIKRRKSYGGPSPDEVTRMLRIRQQLLLVKKKDFFKPLTVKV